MSPVLSTSSSEVGTALQAAPTILAICGMSGSSLPFNNDIAKFLFRDSRERSRSGDIKLGLQFVQKLRRNSASL